MNSSYALITKLFMIYFTAMIASLREATYGEGVTHLHLTVRLASPSFAKRSVVVTLKEDLRKCRCKTLSVHSDPILISGFFEGGKFVVDKSGFAAYSHHLLKRKLRFYTKNKKTICEKMKKWRS